MDGTIPLRKEKTMKSQFLVIVVLVAATFAGCDTGPKSGRGFSLPDGDVQRGKAAFLEFQCNACHSVPGIEQLASEDENRISVALGGEVKHIQTYGELVTSIINPSHRLAKGYPDELIEEHDQSRMRNYNDVMTVSQLIDLVDFLQSEYTLKPYEPTTYEVYPYL
jgi:sulfur-oxidizing protein SoxX